MPHQRKRTITDALTKRLKLWPALGLIGPRQCGKSTFLRELLPQNLKTSYYTMDSKTAQTRAQRSPEAFTEPEIGKIKIIDEIQKVPDLFDAVKLHIDARRRPGTYILSGSTQFSVFTGIRESLTGRIGIFNLYPFNLSEIHSKTFGNYFLKKGVFQPKVTLNEFDKKVEKGGMPGFFYLHSEDEYSASAQLWLETTCYRDLAKILRKDFDGEFALQLLTELVQSFPPTAANVASRLKKDSRIIRRYLDGFTEILVLKKIFPHLVGTGKDHYLLVDSGLASYLGASRETALRCHVLIEALSNFEAAGLPSPRVEYYQSPKKSFVPFLFVWKNIKRTLLVQICDSESPSRGEIAAVQSFLAKTENVRPLILTQSAESYIEDGIEYHSLRA